MCVCVCVCVCIYKFKNSNLQFWNLSKGYWCICLVPYNIIVILLMLSVAQAVCLNVRMN